MDYAVLKKNFENHRFHTSYFETKEEAAAYLSNQIKGEKVGFGGSITAKEMNLFEILKKNSIEGAGNVTIKSDTGVRAASSARSLRGPLAFGIKETGAIAEGKDVVGIGDLQRRANVDEPRRRQR